MSPDFITIVVTRQEIQAGNKANVLESLRTLISSPETARTWFERVDIAIDGYNQTREELFEIVEVRNFVQELDDEFPFWLFFLSKRDTGLQCIAYCFLPPFLTQSARAEISPKQLDSLLTKRWFPAMNQICDWVGMPEDDIEKLSDRSVQYLLGGPIG
jgi:hypothetical protein